MELPSGTVTFLFTDLVGSTRLWQDNRGTMSDALAQHDELLRTSIERGAGHVVKHTGDGLLAAFATASAAVNASVDAQRAMASAEWPTSEPLTVRMGLHTGTAVRRDHDYFGVSLNRAARLMGVAHGGQIVCSQATAELSRDDLPDEIELRDLGEHRLRDLARPEMVSQVTARGLQTDFPPLTTHDLSPGNLPPLDALIGREQEIANVSAALETSRILTLLGPGGVGKTSVAVHAATRAASRFHDGAWLIELAGVPDAQALAPTVAEAIGVAGGGGKNPADALIGFLSTKSVLLVVDNCEHLIDAVAELAHRLSQACVDLVVLVTSRERLNVKGERVVPLAPLSVPATAADLDHASAASAVQLFVERATRVDPDFQLTTANVDAVAEACRRLDGLPLAIELAAAQVSMMSPAELARGLDRRFVTLAAGERATERHHESLRATIDWSVGLCTEPERQLLWRLAVFAGSWTRAAAEGACCGGMVEAPEVFDLLRRLVATSLVVAQPAEETRYRLLESIRAFAEEHLEEFGELESVRRRHAEWFCEHARQVAATARADGPAEAGRRLLPDHDNLLAAMTFAVEHDDADLALRILRHATDPAITSDRRLRIPVAAIRLASAASHPLLPFGLVRAAQDAAIRGLRAEAGRLCDEAVESATLLGDANAIVEELVAETRATVAYSNGNLPKAGAHQERAAIVAAANGRPESAARYLGSAATAHTMAGAPEEALDLAERGLALARSLGSSADLSHNLTALAGALVDSDRERASDYLRQSVELGAVSTVTVLVSARLGDWPLVLECVPGPLRYLRWNNDRPSLFGVLNVVARALAPQDPEAAARMDPHNPRRTIRALEVIEVTGRPYSASLPHYRYVIPTVQIGLDLPREELDRRIDIRTKQMLEGGFIEEVERIRPKLGITAAKALGYQQVVDYLDGLRDLNDTFMDIAQKTKRLARKQMGWFGRDPRIHWLQALNPALLDNAMAIIEHADAGAYDAIDAQADAYTQHHLGDLA